MSEDVIVAQPYSNESCLVGFHQCGSDNGNELSLVRARILENFLRLVLIQDISLNDSQCVRYLLSLGAVQSRPPS